MADTRKKDANWSIGDGIAENRWTFDQVHTAILMDIRDEAKETNTQLRRLNNLLHCQNFIAIPRKLDAISRKLPTRKKRRPA